MSPTNLTLLSHPTLHCKLLGKLSKSTIQYRGLQYATVPSRWQESLPLDKLLPNSTIEGIDVHDATHFGPSCPQKRGAQAWDLTLMSDTLHLTTEEGQGDGEKMDEFGCLHVNVTVPRTAIGKSSTGEKNGLPVFVWVHGGGLAMGSNSWPQYDLAKFVERSVQIGNPIIAVSIDYRIGIFGFLASEELGNAEGNLGFKDLVLAFRWVKKHIHGFGGDLNNITAAGESAGGISLSTLLCGETGDEGLFERVVIMSGEVTLRKPRGRRWHEEMYKEQLKYLGLDQMGREQRLNKLTEWDAEEMCQVLPLVQTFCAVVDGKWLKEEVTLGVLGDGGHGVHKPGWCREFVVGDTAHDGTVLKDRILDNPSTLTLLHSLCTKHLSTPETHALLTAYNLPLFSPSSSPPTPLTCQQSHSLLQLASELRFYLPTLVVEQGWRARFPSSSSSSSSSTTGSRVSRYHFHAPNEFPSPFHGLASHELDVGFLLQNLSEHLPEQSLQASEAMADHFIKYVNGEGWSKDGEVIVFGDKGVQRISEQGYDRVWREGRGEVLKGIGADKLWRLAEGWQRVRADVDENGDSNDDDDDDDTRPKL
ncbi:alpha/beta-hydrolase [Pleomassaria siparia CBS 279.74]|uniref:Alpha/beta-hydrolase n=1 Tax=Pleomassaria siparia CBS 279.74 TaxID=1314801 RepID=A0A6G1K531_9PLEO|nr:alpha/beta-hydrolase [Pleomassaria siparia CBS 279.74]